MLQSILKFMQENDKNGEWLTATENDKTYILGVIESWITEHNMEVTARTQNYIDYLKI